MRYDREAIQEQIDKWTDLKKTIEAVGKIKSGTGSKKKSSGSGKKSTADKIREGGDRLRTGIQI